MGKTANLLTGLLSPPSGQQNSDLPGEPVGVVQYNNFFTSEELAEMEREADITDEEARTGRYMDQPLTHQPSKKGARISRTKFFFAARYLWTKEQMEAPDSAIAEGMLSSTLFVRQTPFFFLPLFLGIRADVASPPRWMKKMVEEPLVEANILGGYLFF